MGWEGKAWEIRCGIQEKELKVCVQEEEEITEGKMRDAMMVQGGKHTTWQGVTENRSKVDQVPLKR